MDRRVQRDRLIAQAAGGAVAAAAATSDWFAIEWAVAAGVFMGALTIFFTSLILARGRKT